MSYISKIIVIGNIVMTSWPYQLTNYHLRQCVHKHGMACFCGYSGTKVAYSLRNAGGSYHSMAGDGCLQSARISPSKQVTRFRLPPSFRPLPHALLTSALTVEWDNRTLGALKRHRTYPIAPYGDGGVADGTGFSERVTAKQTRPKGLTHSK